MTGKKIAGSIVFDCAVRAAKLKEDFMKAVDAIKEVLNGVPLIGFETMCERDQFIKLCQTLKEEKGYVATVASITLTKLYTGKLDNV